MGRVIFGSALRAASAIDGIGDTLAVGHVVYAENIPLVPMDDSWILSQKPVTRSIVLLIGEVRSFSVTLILSHPPLR